MPTQWTNQTAGTKRYDSKHGIYHKQTWIVPGVSGDNGGTITTKMNKILNTTITVQPTVDGSPKASLTWRVSGKTVVVAYTDPKDTHKVNVTVLGA